MPGHLIVLLPGRLVSCMFCINHESFFRILHTRHGSLRQDIQTLSCQKGALKGFPHGGRLFIIRINISVLISGADTQTMKECQSVRKAKGGQNLFHLLRSLSPVTVCFLIHVGQITAAVAGHQNLSAHPVAPVDQQNPLSFFCAAEGRRHTGRAAPCNNGVIFFHWTVFSLRLSCLHSQTFLPRCAPVRKKLFPRIPALREDLFLFLFHDQTLVLFHVVIAHEVKHAVGHEKGQLPLF